MSMRITFLSPPPNLSGGERVVSTYAKLLAARGHMVRVICSQPDQPTLARCFKNLLKGRGWPRRNVIGDSHFENDGIDYRVVNHAGPIVDNDIVAGDAVIATFWTTAEWAAKLAPAKGKGLYFIQHDEAMWSGLPDRTLKTWSLPLKKITISSWLVDLAHARGDKNVALIHNSVDTSLFHAGDRKKNAMPSLGFLYSLVTFKGVEVTLAALELIKREMPECKMHCFGTSPPPEGMLPNYITFTKSPAQEELRRHYSSYDVWVCGSHSEGFHLPPLEAMACGTPVVSTRVGGPTDIVRDGENGYLVDVGDSAEIARSVLSILKMPSDEWEKLSLGALDTALTYTWADATDKFEAALVAAVNGDWDEFSSRDARLVTSASTEN